jgi:hypothetical protein
MTKIRNSKLDAFLKSLNMSFGVIPAQETVSQLTKRHILLFCHSGLDPGSRVFPIVLQLDAGSSPA